MGASDRGENRGSNTLLNTVSTNVPGPQIPLYMAGHKVLASFGCGMLSANIGLFNAIISYNQMLTNRARSTRSKPPTCGSMPIV